MTLGAITQATRIEVYSKTQGGEWNFTYIDLNEMKGDDNPLLPEPVHVTIPPEYASLVKLIMGPWSYGKTGIEKMQNILKWNIGLVEHIVNS